MTIYSKTNNYRALSFFMVIGVLSLLAIVYNKTAYAAGTIYGACAGMPQTQAICTNDLCGTGVATNYSYMQYNGYATGIQGACSQYCCSTTAPSPTVTAIPTTTTTPSPTVTPSPSVTPTQPTSLNLTVCLHGLGNCGDNVSPNAGGNTNVVHLSRHVIIGLFDATNQLVTSLTGNLGYSSSSAKFLVTISVPDTVQSGQYLVKISTDGFLSKQYPGILQLNTGQTMTLPAIALVTGDINNDSQIDILDYNLLTSCFGAKVTTSSCSTPPTVASAGSDINDDGVVDAADYNLFLRELSVQKSN